MPDPVRVAIPPQSIVRNKCALVTFTAADATNDHKFLNDGNTELLVVNGGSGACALTVKSVADQYGRLGDLTLSVTPGHSAVVPSLDPTLFNQADGYVYVDIDEDTTVTLAAIRRG